MHKYKNDRFKHSRGGSSKFISINCALCKTFIMLYQKDGPGSLKRTYFDRIIEPSSLFKKIEDYGNNSAHTVLTCPKCKEMIGTSYIYSKENRPAFLMIRGSFSKAIYKNTGKNNISA